MRVLSGRAIHRGRSGDLRRAGWCFSRATASDDRKRRLSNLKSLASRAKAPTCRRVAASPRSSVPLHQPFEVGRARRPGAGSARRRRSSSMTPARVLGGACGSGLAARPFPALLAFRSASELIVAGAFPPVGPCARACVTFPTLAFTLLTLALAVHLLAAAPSAVAGRLERAPLRVPTASALVALLPLLFALPCAAFEVAFGFFQRRPCPRRRSPSRPSSRGFSACAAIRRGGRAVPLAIFELRLALVRP